MNETEFLEHLRSEKLKAAEARTNYALRKLAYVTALLGIGSVDIEKFNLSALLYLVPFVALAFDLYILGEDYSVKRIGAFLGAKNSGALEQQWEQWVSNNRDPFAPVAMPILTTLAFLGAAIVIWIGSHPGSPFFWMWMALAWLPSWGLFVYHRRRRQDALESVQSIRDRYPQPSKPLQRLRSAVEKTEYILNRKTFNRTRHLFTACKSKPRLSENVQKLASEYGKQEFLLCVDRQGSPVYLPQDVIEDFRETINRSPDFEDWFQEATIKVQEQTGAQGSERVTRFSPSVTGKIRSALRLSESTPETVEGRKRPTLLVARWLCHLVGFRHRTVHLFIDYPIQDDCYTLVQVRGTDKFESPGRFDLPAAGHVVNLEPPMETLFEELQEELNWHQDDVDEPKWVGKYNYCEPASNPVLRNVEFRDVYTSRLKSTDLSKIKFVDGEVAALSIFKLRELEMMVSDFPERVASGLRKSLPLYLKSKDK